MTITPRIPLKFAQAAMSITHGILPESFLEKLGPLSKVTPETVEMMTKGSVKDNKNWVKYTKVRPVSLHEAYEAYSRKTNIDYSFFLDTLRKEKYINPNYMPTKKNTEIITHPPRK